MYFKKGQKVRMVWKSVFCGGSNKGVIFLEFLSGKMPLQLIYKPLLLFLKLKLSSYKVDHESL